MKSLSSSPWPDRTGRRGQIWLLACLGAVIAARCTDAHVYQVDREPIFPDRLTLMGRICTDDPNRQRFPLRLLIAVDASQEMAGLDPDMRRVVAVEDVVGRYATTAGLEIALVRFAGRPEMLTTGFTHDITALGEAATELRQTVPCVDGRCRDLAALLSLVEATVSDDALSAEPGRLVRTRYVTVLLTAGSSDPPLLPDEQGCDEACQLSSAIESMAIAVGNYGARKVVTHVLQYAAPQSDPTVQQQARTVLQALAVAGQGQLLTRNAASLLRLSDLPLFPVSDALVFRSFLVTNASVLPGVDGPRLDSDADGLPDMEESAAGLDLHVADSDGDGIGDFVERLLEVNDLHPLQPDQPDVCAGLPAGQDRDGDRLNDCEERLLGLEPTLTDSDRDGLPDGEELLGGTNPWSDDMLADPDVDGQRNREELREHADPRSSDSRGTLEHNYRYTFVDEGSQWLPYVSDVRQLRGVTVVEVGRNTPAGAGVLSFLPGPPATLSWRDADAAMAGPAVQIAASGRVVLPATSLPEDEERTLTINVISADLPTAEQHETLLVGQALRTCASYAVRNVRLMETKDAGQEQGVNHVRLMFGEVPNDDPAAFPIFRAAEIAVRFIAPDIREPDGILFVEDQDFVLLGRWQ